MVQEKQQFLEWDCSLVKPIWIRGCTYQRLLWSGCPGWRLELVISDRTTFYMPYSCCHTLWVTSSCSCTFLYCVNVCKLQLHLVAILVDHRVYKYSPLLHDYANVSCGSIHHGSLWWVQLKKYVYTVHKLWCQIMTASICAVQAVSTPLAHSDNIYPFQSLPLSTPFRLFLYLLLSESDNIVV